MGTVGSRIKSLRLRLALSQDQLCKEIGIKTSSLSRIENGNTDPSMSTIIALMQYFNVSSDWILTGEDAITKEANKKTAPCINQLSEELNEQIPVIRDRKLRKYIRSLINLWTEGNSDIKGWIIIQLEKAFPEIAEEIKREHEKEETSG
jgi:transcriptional regulator with XRE-family HTH domain